MFLKLCSLSKHMMGLSYCDERLIFMLILLKAFRVSFLKDNLVIQLQPLHYSTFVQESCKTHHVHAQFNNLCVFSVVYRRLEDNPHTSMFGTGPERGMFEHLAPEVRLVFF